METEPSSKGKDILSDVSYIMQESAPHRQTENRSKALNCIVVKHMQRSKQI